MSPSWFASEAWSGRRTAFLNSNAPVRPTASGRAAERAGGRRRIVARRLPSPLYAVDEAHAVAGGRRPDATRWSGRCTGRGTATRGCRGPIPAARRRPVAERGLFTGAAERRRRGLRPRAGLALRPVKERPIVEEPATKELAPSQACPSRRASGARCRRRRTGVSLAPLLPSAPWAGAITRSPSSSASRPRRSRRRFDGSGPDWPASPSVGVFLRWADRVPTGRGGPARCRRHASGRPHVRPARAQSRCCAPLQARTQVAPWFAGLARTGVLPRRRWKAVSAGFVPLRRAAVAHGVGAAERVTGSSTPGADAHRSEPGLEGLDGSPRRAVSGTDALPAVGASPRRPVSAAPRGS